MRQSDADDLIRESYERNSPAVDVDVAWEMLRTRMTEADRHEESPDDRPAIRPVSAGEDRQPFATRVTVRRASTSGRRSGWRVAVYASVAIVLVAGIIVGSLEAVNYLGREHRVVVIGEDPAGMSPGSTGPVTATTTGGAPTTIPATSPITAVAPPTTDSPFSLETRLPNGHFRGLVFIIHVNWVGIWEENRGIKVDFLEVLTGEEARAAAVEDGVIPPGEDLPDDYYIRNLTPGDQEQPGLAGEGGYAPSFVVDRTAVITTYTFGDGGERSITWEQFSNFWHPTSPPEGGEHMLDVPWWIERDEKGNVVSITEFRMP